MIKIGRSKFEYDAKDTLLPWKISSEDGSVDIVFSPQGKRQQSIDYKIISSRFQQPFGLFSGTCTLPDGRRVIIDNQPGVVEEHHARW